MFLIRFIIVLGPNQESYYVFEKKRREHELILKTTEPSLETSRKNTSSDQSTTKATISSAREQQNSEKNDEQLTFTTISTMQTKPSLVTTEQTILKSTYVDQNNNSNNQIRTENFSNLPNITNIIMDTQTEIHDEENNSSEKVTISVDQQSLITTTPQISLAQTVNQTTTSVYNYSETYITNIQERILTYSAEALNTVCVSYCPLMRTYFF